MLPPKKRFSIGRIGKAGARLNLSKLDWMSGDYIRRMTLEEVILATIPHLQAVHPIHSTASKEAKVRMAT